MNDVRLLNEALGIAACTKLQELTGLPVQWVTNEEPGQEAPHGHIRIGQGPTAQHLAAMVRVHVSEPKVLEGVRKQDPLVMVGTHASDADQTILRRRGMNYLLVNGNCCIQLPSLFILIEGQAQLPKSKPKRQRAFSKAGLKVVFLLLSVQESIKWTVREIARSSGTSTGNVSLVLNALQQDGHIVHSDARRKVLANKEQLLGKWVQGYQQRLRPSLELGRYRFVKPEVRTTWREVPLDGLRTCWGSEAAGALLTEHLHPGELALYTNEPRVDLIRRYGLVPDERGDVQVFHRFWSTAIELGAAGNACPPLLAYADLVNSIDSRLLETAQLVKEKHLHGLLS